jgi:hypothetical protein
MAGPIVYDLTPMTRAGEVRRTVFFTFDIPLPAVITAVAVLPVAAIVTAILFPIFGVSSIIALFAVEAIGLFAILQRSKKGMRSKVWRSALDAKVNNNNSFIISGMQIDLDESRMIYIIPSSVPASAV